MRGSVRAGGAGGKRQGTKESCWARSISDERIAVRDGVDPRMAGGALSFGVRPGAPSAVSNRSRPKAVRIVDAGYGRDSLADTLQEALPPGAEVAVLWRDPNTGISAGSASPGATSALASRAEVLLQHSPVGHHSHRIEIAWTTAEGVRVAIAAQLPGPIAAEVREIWLGMAQRVVVSHLVALRTLA